MDKHGRLTEDYAHLRHHTALTGERLSPQQRKDNAEYNAAVRARSDMLATFGSSPRFAGAVKSAPRNARPVAKVVDTAPAP